MNGTLSISFCEDKLTKPFVFITNRVVRFGVATRLSTYPVAKKATIMLLIAYSLLGLSGPISAGVHLSIIPSVRALPAPCPTHSSTGVCSEFWYPAGSAMDSEQIAIFSGPSAEGNCPPGPPIACFSGLQTDLTDSPVSQVGVLNDSSVYITAPIAGTGTNGQFAYLSNWQRVVNDEQAGIPNYFTWLNAYSPNPLIPSTVRQAFAESTHSLNPYVASTSQDFFVVRNIYDSLSVQNPLGRGQLLDWMVVSSSPSPLPNSQLGYTSPIGTIGTYRFNLRNDLFFQDGRKVTAFDVAFSYLSLKANGAFQAQGASSMTGITVLSSTQFDIGISSAGFSTKPNLTSLTIMPARYWTVVGASLWDISEAACSSAGSNCYPAQYSLGPVPPTGPPMANCSLNCAFAASNMDADPVKATLSFDPLATGMLIGSGPWECKNTTTGIVGTGCPLLSQNPPLGGGYTLARYGAGHAPGASLTDSYFRSNGAMALWAWSGNNGDFTHDFINFSVVARCVGQAVTGTSTGCGHWQEGIGGDVNSAATRVDVSQIGIVSRFVGVNWVAPFEWRLNPPTGIAPFPPVLYAGSETLSPASTVGCTMAYPAGGYDC